MALAYDDDMPPSIPSEDNDENEVHEEGLNEMLTGFFGDENNDDPIVDNNYDTKRNFQQHNVDYINLSDSIKQAAKTVVFKSGASRTSKLSCTLILLEIKSLFGWSNKSFTTLLR